MADVPNYPPVEPHICVKDGLEAIAFYEKNMFRVIGRRKMFYANPSEDALLMSASPAN